MRAFRWIFVLLAISTWQATSTQASETVPADRLFQNKTGQVDLSDFVGKPVWELLAACSGFARAVAGYHAANNKAEDHKLWTALSLESYSTAQYLIGESRSAEDDAARALLNPLADERHKVTAEALAKLDPASGTAETFQQETLILRGPYSRMCFAASLETE